MIKLWNEDEEDGGLVIARLIKRGDVPRGLRRKISLESGDEALIIAPSNEDGIPMTGPDDLKTKEALRGRSQILLYNRREVYEFEFPFNDHRPPGEMDLISGSLRLGVRILDERPALIKERLLPSLSGKSKVTYLDAQEAIRVRLESRWEQLLQGSNASNRRDPGRREEAWGRARDVAREAIEPLGLFAADAELVWADTGVEESLKDPREVSRRQREKLAEMRKEERNKRRLSDSIEKMEYELERERARMENLRAMAEIYGLEI